MEKVVVGVSGGVDSAVSAYLLQQQGYTVIGVYMNHLGNATEQAAAARVCAQLGIAFHVVDYQTVFHDQIVARYQRERHGDVTPNPCCWCNPTVKFRCLTDFADQHGIKWVATGHYARVQNGVLLRGADPKKDQSYFLAGLSSDQLARVLFPLGGMTKPAVRELAAQIGLTVYNKPDSTDMCFNVPVTGPTIGQGVKQGGQPAKLYYLGNGQVGPATDPALYRQTLTVTKFNFIQPWLDTCQATGKVRYRQVDQPCTATRQADGTVVVTFRSPVRAVTPGQWCVLYAGDQVLGGGEIR